MIEKFIFINPEYREEFLNTLKAAGASKKKPGILAWDKKIVCSGIVPAGDVWLGTLEQLNAEACEGVVSGNKH
jgi:hypothetical protein